MVWSTTFIRTSLPTKIKDLLVQLLTLSLRLFIISSHTALLRGLSVKGIPRYLEGRFSCWKPRTLNRCLWIVMSVLKMKTLDFERLTSVLASWEKSFNICLKDLTSLIVGVPYSIVSSTNYWCINASPFWVSFSPLILPYFLAVLIILPNPSIMRMKRNGEKGSPCLRPREGLKVLEGEPLRRIELLVVVTSAMTHFI